MVHHDRRLNADIARGADGRWIEKPTPTIHSLTFEELQRYDVGRVRPGSDYAKPLPGQRPADGTRIPRLADVFALLSRHEPWGVVVNEAAACGLPLVVSDRVGAAFDLVVDGLNGVLVPADDPGAAGDAIRALATDPERRRAAGRASRELMREWGYEPSIENLIRVTRRVAGRQPPSASS